MMRACLFFAAVLAVGDHCVAFTTLPSAAAIRALGSSQVSDDSVTTVRRQTYAGFLDNQLGLCTGTRTADINGVPVGI